jgi:ABC-2 type transport system ATP-binding protein
MLMDLIRPSKGTARVFGEDTRSNPDALKRVGALVEGAAFYNHLTGRGNLEVLGRTANNYQPERVKALLDQVGLGESAHRQVGTYSTGMKQRLGIAAALLNDPDLVIFDEPTSGLDPAGIQDMRAFIRNLVEKEDKTVFLSSHLLNEVEQICDRVAIIHQGEILREGNVAELLAEGQSKIRVQAAPLDKAKAVLEAKWSVTTEADWLIVSASSDDSPEIIKRLVNVGIAVHQTIIQRQSLEDYFMAVTNQEPQDD